MIVGFNNTGSICWLNSLLQSLLACPAFKKNLTPDNELSAEILGEISPQYSQRVLKALRRGIESAGCSFNIAPSQECACEGLTYIIDIINSEAIGKLFAQAFRNKIICGNCKHDNENRDRVYITWVPETVRIPCQQIISEINSYKCDECNAVSKSTKIERMSYIGEIAIFALNKIHKKYIHYGVPTQFKIKSLDGIFWVYKISSAIIHYGRADGGHYVAYVMHNGIYYLANDTCITPTKKTAQDIIIDPNLFMIFYSRTIG